MEPILQNKKKKFIAIGVILFLLVSVGLTVYIQQQQQRTRSKASANDVTLTFNPSSGSAAINDTFPVVLSVDVPTSQQLTISGVDVTLTFPQNDLQLISFDPPARGSNYLSLPIIDILGPEVTQANQTGRVRYMAGANEQTPPGSLIVGTFTFKRLTANTAAIAFDAATTVTTENNASFTLDKSASANFTVVQTVSPTEQVSQAPSAPPPSPTATTEPTPTLIAATNTPMPPTPSILPTATLYPTPTFIPGATVLNFPDNLTLSGIGRNALVLNPQVPVTFEILDEDENPVLSNQSGYIEYKRSLGKFGGKLATNQVLQPGNYLVRLKADKYLSRTLPGIIPVTSNGPNEHTISTTVLLAGDISSDNKLDIDDYNRLVSCFGIKLNTPSCGEFKDKADLDNDGDVDGVDYNIFITNLSHRTGD